MPRESPAEAGEERAAAAESRCRRLEQEVLLTRADLEDEKQARHAQASQLRVAKERLEAANMERRAAVQRLGALEKLVGAPAAKRRKPAFFSLPRRSRSSGTHRVVPDSDEEAPRVRKRARPAENEEDDVDVEEQVVRFVQDWGDQMLAGNELMLHEARRLEEGQVIVALQATRDGPRHRRGDGALEDALLRATQNGHLGMVAHHLHDAECRERLREVLADIPDDEISSDDDVVEVDPSR